MKIALDQISFRGRGLQRPECVLATSDGTLYTSDWGGGVSMIATDGTVTRLLAKGPFDVQPNGIALRRGGSFLIAHLGAESGGIFELDRHGHLSPLLLEVDGRALPPTNYVLEDAEGRIWVTVSTRLMPRNLGYRRDVADGFIVLLDRGESRIVADGLGYTNEIAFDPTGEWLYVNETFARRLTRFRVGAKGDLFEPETVAEFAQGIFPDGMALDEEGAVWIVSIVSNRVIRVLPDGRQEILLEDFEPAHLDWVEAAYRDGTMARAHLDDVKSRKLRNVSSIAFGGKDLRTVHLGCLLGDSIAEFRSCVAGIPPRHWFYGP